MENTTRKLWLITLFLTLLSISFNLLRENRKEEEILGVDNRSIEEVVVLEDLDIALTPKEENSDNTLKEGVYVPYYWKTGINIESHDYLFGHIPSIKEFNEYYISRNSILFGVDPKKYSYAIAEVLRYLNLEELIYSNGIENYTQYFSWIPEDCKIVSLSDLDREIFVCPNWLNWSGMEIRNKSYVVTECNIEDLEGYCLFEEYSKIYYDSKNLGEERCFQNDNEGYFCDYKEYIKQIEYN